MQLDVDSEAAGRYQLPPVTLAELFQNAIKHNAISADGPLTIRVAIERGAGDATLAFANDLRVRRAGSASKGVGLQNISRRVKLGTGREVTWGVEEGRFVVRIPLVQGKSS